MLGPSGKHFGRKLRARDEADAHLIAERLDGVALGGDGPGRGLKGFGGIMGYRQL